MRHAEVLEGRIQFAAPAPTLGFTATYFNETNFTGASTVVSGQDAGRDVPVSVLAHDPQVLDRIAGWGWEPGVSPGEQAPVWPCSAC